MPKVMMEKSKSQKQSWDIPIRSITQNTNPRNPLSAELQKQGWDCMTGEKPIWKLATSDDAGERAQYVKLIQEQDPEIASLAATILSQGILQPIEVREGGTGTYTLAFGARRCLAVLYNWCLLGKPREPVIEARLCKGNSTQLLHRAVIENIRKPQSVIDEARAIRAAMNNSESKQDIADQLGMSVQTVNSRLSLLDLEPKEQQAIHEGRTNVKKVREAQAESNGHVAGPKMRKKKEVEEARDEFVNGSKEWKTLEWVLGNREDFK